MSSRTVMNDKLIVTYLFYSDVMMSTMAIQITGVSIVCSSVCPGADTKIKAPGHWPLWGESIGDRCFPSQRASNAEIVSIWWRHVVGTFHTTDVAHNSFNHIKPIDSQYRVPILVM